MMRHNATPGSSSEDDWSVVDSLPMERKSAAAASSDEESRSLTLEAPERLDEESLRGEELTSLDVYSPFGDSEGRAVPQKTPSTSREEDNDADSFGFEIRAPSTEHLPFSDGEDEAEEREDSRLLKALQLEADIRAATAVPKVRQGQVERWHKVLVAGGPKVGKSTLLRCLHATFSSSAGGEEASWDTDPDAWPDKAAKYCSSATFVDSQTNITHHFVLQDSPPVYADLRHLETYVKKCQQAYSDVEKDPERTMPMSAAEDGRVDICLYLISPHCFDDWEVDLIYRLNKLVPVIPIMAKADSMTASELETLRKYIQGQMAPESQWLGSTLTASVLKEAGAPESGIFAISASDELDDSVSRSGWPVRRYPWGTVEPMSRAHSDLLSLRRLLFEVAPELLKAETEQRYLKKKATQLLIPAGSWVPEWLGGAKPEREEEDEMTRLCRAYRYSWIQDCPLISCSLLVISMLFLSAVLGMCLASIPHQAAQPTPGSFCQPGSLLASEETGFIDEVSAVLNRSGQEPAYLEGVHPDLVLGMKLVFEDLLANSNLTAGRRGVYEQSLQQLEAPTTKLFQTLAPEDKEESALDWGSFYERQSAERQAARAADSEEAANAPPPKHCSRPASDQQPPEPPSKPVGPEQDPHAGLGSSFSEAFKSLAGWDRDMDKHLKRAQERATKILKNAAASRVLRRVAFAQTWM